MSTNNGFGGVSECYAFKSRLQEYAQKVGFPTPVYQTVMEGPSHEPVFKSTVIVNNVKYDSLPGFYNRKTAEQSAAEVALMEIHKAGQKIECIPTVHETGLCKNLLQEYAQKMNFAVPSYVCKKLPSSVTPFSCTVEIGGIQYIGAAAKTKKEAEIKAARTALLAIQTSSRGNEMNVFSQYTVVPGKRKGREVEAQAETANPLKPKKPEFKKKGSKRKFPRNRGDKTKSNKNAQRVIDKEDFPGAHNNDAQLPEAVDSSAAAELEGPKKHQNECGFDNTAGDSMNQGEHASVSASESNGHFHDEQPKEKNTVESNKGCSKAEDLSSGIDNSSQGEPVTGILSSTRFEPEYQVPDHSIGIGAEQNFQVKANVNEAGEGDAAAQVVSHSIGIGAEQTFQVKANANEAGEGDAAVQVVSDLPTGAPITAQIDSIGS